MTFQQTRRQKFLGQKAFEQLDIELAELIARRKKALVEEELIPQAIQSFRWSIASSTLELLILRYTAGLPVESLCDQMPTIIQEFDELVEIDQPEIPGEAYTFDIPQLEAYVYVLWLLALCRMLGRAELVPTVIAWLDRRAKWNRGRDCIFENVVQMLTGGMHEAGRKALHIDGYRPLGRAILAENPDDRPALVKEFVENWYKNMKPCYWHGLHTGSRFYFGYWCFEAALVTYLWDIDDSSYRDHLVYPKDLVDYARANHPYKGPETGSSPKGLLAHLQSGGCPRSAGGMSGCFDIIAGA